MHFKWHLKKLSGQHSMYNSLYKVSQVLHSGHIQGFSFEWLQQAQRSSSLNVHARVMPEECMNNPHYRALR